jgi:hypothetical protein
MELMKDDEKRLLEDVYEGLGELSDEFSDKLEEAIDLVNKNNMELEKNVSAKLDTLQIRYDILMREHFNKIEKLLNNNNHNRDLGCQKDLNIEATRLETRMKWLTILGIVSVIISIANFIFQ